MQGGHKRWLIRTKSEQIYSNTKECVMYWSKIEVSVSNILAQLENGLTKLFHLQAL